MEYEEDPLWKENARRQKTERARQREAQLYREADALARANPTKYIWNRARQRAKKTGIPFTIEPSDIVIPERCPYLGFRLFCVGGEGYLKNGASLDRKNNALGYIPGNVQVISNMANTMKQDASIEMLRRFAKGILEVHGHG